ncbi:PAS domain S-box protein [Halovulum dunhuangense]|uniref:histidine kinase n=1 Tax=Halovulum dunhuangense TaxID=1505036 RepID=A0A849L7T5_9RHOB|nr:PAS domain S-box protein [Halovulum dunhuangense]NNU82194.1 PAS domain S-box protein [Halovulum dunhuangense]
MTKFPALSRTAIEAYDQLSFPVWVFSTETLRILSANAAAQHWVGYDALTLQEMTIAELRPEGDQARVVEQIRRFDGTQADAGTWTIISRSGEHRTASFTWSKVTFEGAEAIVASIRDITQIIKVEVLADNLNKENEKLRHKASLSAAHLSSLLDGLPGKMVVLSPGEYQIVAVTDEYAKAVMVDRNTLLKGRLLDLFPDNPAEPQADGAGNLRASLRRVEALRVADVMNTQRYPIRQADGTFQERFWLPRNKPILDADGNVIYIVHRVEDVTEVLASQSVAAKDTLDATESRSLQLAEARTALFALKERETRLKTAEMLLDLGSWEYEFARGALTWSDRVFEIYGVPRDRDALDFDGYVALVHPDDREEMVSTYAHFFETNAPEIKFQHRIIRADGTISYIRGVGARHQVDGQEIVIGFVQDITAVKQNEEALMRQARRRRLAGHLARLGSWSVDLRSSHVFWCEETAMIHDEPEGFSPTLEQAIAYYIPEHRERIRAQFEACATKGRPFDDTLEIKTAQARRVWVRALGEAIRNEDGEIVAVEGAFQDLTDLIAIRDEAAQLSERLHATLEGMHDGFYLLDNDWRFQYVNTKAERLLQRRRDELLGRVAWDEFPEASRNIKKHYELALYKKRLVRFDEYYPPLNTWFEISADPTPAGLAVYFRDVTRQRAQEAHLRLLETAVSHQNDILVITEAEPISSPDGPRIIYVNDAFERRTGYSREEVLGRTPRILQGPKTQRDELDRIRHALENWQPVRSELINYTKSGEEFWLELDIVPLADEKGWFTHWIAVERDITARKQADLALQNNEERFRLVAKAAGSAIWDWDATANKLSWSDGLKDIFGHEVDPSGAVPTIWRRFVHPDDVARVDAAISSLKTGKDTSLRLQYRFQRADGSWAVVQDNAFALRDEAGRVYRVLGSMTDISEQKLLEERLRQAQKMEAVGHLTGGVAHDFNNLLTIILGNAEILEGELSDLPHLQKLARMSLDAADRGAALTSRLLAFSRKQPLDPKVIDVAHLIQGMDGLLRRTLPENIDIEIVRSGGLWKIEADASQLEAALLNLAVNARDAMPDGGSLTIEMANAKLDDDYVAMEPDVRAGQYVVIVVTDTGTGMPPDVLARVFEPFFTTKEVGKGSGLGLSMVFGFVKQSGGHIRIYSELNEGTAAKMYFPRSQTERKSVAAISPGRRIAGGTETILLVEDDNTVREFATAQLQGLGYHVLEAATGAEALEVLSQTSEIDLLFTDVVMPGGMGGRQLADKACKLQPGLKVLFTSGYTENSIVHQGRLDPGVMLLSKPYRRGQLAAKIREVLGVAEKQDQTED